jgi:16S rRNA processing protein RimM
LIDKDQLIIIGKITKPVGLKGELKVLAITDFPDRFKKLKDVYLLDKEETGLLANSYTGDIKFRIKDVKVSDSILRISFDHYDSPEKVTILKSCFICIPEKYRYKLPKNQYYFYDLIGCEVYDKGDILGTVKKIENYGSAELISVQTLKGSIILIPFIKEFVKNVDLTKKMISVELIEGFF